MFNIEVANEVIENRRKDIFKVVAGKTNVVLQNRYITKWFVDNLHSNHEVIESSVEHEHEMGLKRQS